MPNTLAGLCNQKEVLRQSSGKKHRSYPYSRKLEELVIAPDDSDIGCDIHSAYLERVHRTSSVSHGCDGHHFGSMSGSEKNCGT